MANNSTFNPGTSLEILNLTLPHSRLMFLCDSILVDMTEIECDDFVIYTRLLCCPEYNLSQPQSLITITILDKCLLTLIHSMYILDGQVD